MSTQTKIEYDLWANQQILDAIKSSQEKELQAESIRQFAHLFKAQVIWYNRVQQINETVPVWGDYTIEECLSLLNDSSAMLEGIVSEIGKECSYVDTKGVPSTNNVEDIFEHVIIHGQHHRAQIALILRKAGFKPPQTDYIFYLRSL